VIPQFPVYLFDLDGTLLNSAVDICGAVQQTLEGRECRPVTFEYLRTYVGRHLLDLYIELFPHFSPEQIDGLIQEYRRIYLGRGHTQTSVYPGVPEALGALGGRKSIATTKGSPTTRAILEQFGLLQYFDHVQGTDGFPSKPAPDVILAAMAGLNARPEECLMVGDSAADMEAGRAAGVKICAVRYGYGNHAHMDAFQPDYWIEDLRELAGLTPAGSQA
jgi:phosphoglycolate phosphatase